MKNEVSVDTLMSLLPDRVQEPVTVIRGPSTGLSGYPNRFGRDGRLTIAVPQPGPDDPRMRVHYVHVELDWLDTDFAPLPVRMKYRLRRNAVVTPEVILRSWSALLPARVLNEDLGDYVEQLVRARDAGRCVLLYRIAALAVFFTGLNAVGLCFREFVTPPSRRSGANSSQRRTFALVHRGAIRRPAKVRDKVQKT
jgi:hypothetical protein